MAKPGPRNLITDVEGLRIGQAEDARARTGVTVLLPDAPCPAAVDMRGGAPGTRDIEALDPVSLVDGVHGIVLSGGSVFGLDAPGGVVSFLSAQGQGLRLAPGSPPVPVVPGAIVFDLSNGGDKEWGETPPYRALGRAAAEAASREFALGNAGAGFGATAGVYKGGLGSASAVTEDGFTVGAIVVVNAVGSPVIPGTDAFWAFPFEQAGEFGGRRPAADFAGIDLDLPGDMKGAPRPLTNTTIAIVATDATLTRVELKRIAIMASDGFARALRPVHTPFDGDTVFALSTGKCAIAEPRPRDVLRLGSLAADVLSRAIARGVFEAKSLGQTKSYQETFLRG
ncbi:MAG TPA: P1 family peptidase [Rhizomicrobium sp.]|jgi:L-aminopeptidase/D-esterase-like protein|nr:P1 family peptidase [Rhizomicrobium sp.]